MMQNNRHAYLIITHHCPRLLQVLIDMIDDERNDIFIHVNAKADFSQFANIHAEYSKITYTKRVKVYWGHTSLPLAEYILFEAAHNQGPYQYYHVLSGVDLPLKNQDYIHHLLDNVYRGHEFVGFSKTTDFERRVRLYHIFDRHFRKNTRMAHLFSFIRNYAFTLQKKLGIRRNEDINFLYGPAWVSITDDLLVFLLENRKKFKKIYSRTFASDESFIQTFTHDTLFYDRIHDKENEYASCLRLIDWQKEPNRSSPHTWTKEDWEELISSDRLFARKFSEEDMEFIYQLKNYVTNSNTR